MRSWNICSVKAGERLPRGGESVVPLITLVTAGRQLDEPPVAALGRGRQRVPASTGRAGRP